MTDDPDALRAMERGWRLGERSGVAMLAHLERTGALAEVEESFAREAAGGDRGPVCSAYDAILRLQAIIDESRNAERPAPR